MALMRTGIIIMSWFMGSIWERYSFLKRSKAKSLEALTSSIVFAALSSSGHLVLGYSIEIPRLKISI
jgi:hypothetical protein